MGRQLRLIQSEHDYEPYLRAIYSCNGILFHGKDQLSLQEALLQLAQLSPEDAFYAWWILPNEYAAIGIQPSDSTAIQYALPRRRSVLSVKYGLDCSKTYYTGRIFLMSSNDPVLSGLFNRLKTFIRRQYHWEKDPSVYFAPIFWEKKDDMEWLAVWDHNGRPLLQEAGSSDQAKPHGAVTIQRLPGKSTLGAENNSYKVLQDGKEALYLIQMQGGFLAAQHFEETGDLSSMKAIWDKLQNMGNRHTE